MSDAPATKSGTLKHGLRIGDAVHKDFVLRQCTAADYFAAENASSVTKDLTYRAALVAQQLVSIGTFEGPFTLQMLGKLTPGDIGRMCDARDELEREGEAQQPG